MSALSPARFLRWQTPVILAGIGAAIWAWRHDAGEWTANNPERTGWSHQMAFHGLSDLIQRMRHAGLPSGGRRPRHTAGGRPVIFLKARLKAASES
jgi:hypothetical protein